MVRPKVAYVMGAGRSGSTILGITLGNCDGVIYAGEMDKWLRCSGDPPLGGEERERFWREVRERVDVDPELTGKVARCLEASSAPFRARFWGKQRHLRGPYRRFAGELYRTIAQVGHARQIVDTSHFPRRARELQHVEGIDLYLLFLVRDPQSIVASWDRDDVVEPRFTPLQTNAYMWLTYLISLFVFLRHPRKRRLLVRHEDFVANPEGVVRDILDRMESSAPLPDFEELRTGVAFQGNRVAREQVVSLNGSAPRPPRFSLLTAVLQLPWKLVFSLLGPVAGASARRQAR
ncbi:MAG TPA: sulfotransferase [Solirubrobacteraceae bacterium]|nr:sulfotransferase [Solirubrobacteraceae bacterium]